MERSSYLRLKDSTRIKKYDSFCILMNVILGNQKHISPLMAFILALCDGTRNVEDIIYVVLKLFNKEDDQIKGSIIRNLMELLPFIDVMDEKTKPCLRYKPEQFIFNLNSHIPDHKGFLLPLQTPTIMTIALTNRCNFKCIYCFKSSGNLIKDNDELSTAEWINVIQQAKELNILHCTVTGGEPTLHPGFIDIIKCLVDADIFTYISTNGSLITKKVASSLSNLGIGLIQVSLDAPKADLHNMLSHTTDTFQNVIDGISYLRGADMIVRVKSVITPYNYEEVGGLIDLCVSLGVSTITLDKFNPGYGGRGENELILTNKMVEDVEGCIKNKSSQYNGVISIDSALQSLMWKDKGDITPCGGLYSAFAIQPNGNMVICEQLDIDELKIGNIREYKLAEMWGAEKAIKILNPDPDMLNEPCKSCEYLTGCRTGCYSHTLLYDKNIYAPDPACWKVHLSANPLSPIEY